MTPTDQRPQSCSWLQTTMLAGVVLLVACAPRPVERPREGAAPVVGGTAVRLEVLVPPTLVGTGRLSQTSTPTPAGEPPGSPALVIAASPAASPGLSPMISGLQPAPGSSLPAGDVVIGARVTGSSDLADIIAYVDGEAIPVDLEGTLVRVKMVSMVRTLAAGSHEIRIQARDDKGQLGGYRWQFSVGAGRQPVAVPPTERPVAPFVTRTPIPVPTRRILPTNPPVRTPPPLPTLPRPMTPPTP